MSRSDLYCDIHGFNGGSKAPVFFAHDGSSCTMLEVEGVSTIVDEDEFIERMEREFSLKLGTLMSQPGHCLSISYESSVNVEEELDAIALEKLQAASQKGMDVGQLVAEERETLLTTARRERIFVACWTRPNAAPADEVKAERKDTKKRRANFPLAGMQDPNVGIDALRGVHQSFVAAVVDAFDDCGMLVKVLAPGERGSRPDLAEIRRGIFYHETPPDWAPLGAGVRAYPGSKVKKNLSLGNFMNPTLAWQIMAGTFKMTPDDRAIDVGGRRYAVVVMTLFPQYRQPFNSLVHQLLEDATADGRKMPFRVTMHISPKAGNFTAEFVNAAKLVGTAITSWLNRDNSNSFRAMDALNKRMASERVSVVLPRVIATTWTEPGEDPNDLNYRRAHLRRAIEKWGNAQTLDAPSNLMRALSETVAGMVVTARIPRAPIAPMDELAPMMPFHRDAAVFENGECILTTLDGRVAPHMAHSEKQAFWLTTISGSPGSGKSVLVNHMNLDFAAYHPGSRLPYIGIIDVGVSSEGVPLALRRMLPEDQSYLAVYKRLQNSQADCINPLGLSLGCREPLPRERAVIESFLRTLLDVGTDTRAAQLVTRLIERLYQVRKDTGGTAQANRWQRGIEPALDAAAERHGINLSDRMLWWRLVDEFAKAKDFVNATRAQRHAEPTIEDIGKVVSEENMVADFGEETTRGARLAAEQAIRQYPVFCGRTRLDIGSARVIAIDLQDVVPTGGSLTYEGRKNAVLMFLTARQAFVSKISGHRDEINDMRFTDGPDAQRMREIYSGYWERRFADISETKKRLVMDEYHKTGATEEIAKVVETDAREGRKWGLEIILASQFPKDFRDLLSIASTVMVLNPEGEEQRAFLREKVGDWSVAVEDALVDNVKKPSGQRGANFLVRYKLDEKPRFVILKNKLGPRQMWLLATGQESRGLRDELYRRVPVFEALDILAERYPNGSCLGHFRQVQVSMAARSEVEDDFIYRTMVDEIIKQKYGTSALRTGRLARRESTHIMSN